MLNEAMIDEIMAKVQELGASEQTIAQLREEYEGCHFTLCFEDDITSNAKPYRETENFMVYLVDSRDHCSVLTNDEVNASGVVIAEILD